MNKKEFDKLPFTSDFMFGAIMSCKDVVKPFLENLLDVKINDIKAIENQTVFNKSYENKGIRLDVYVESKDDIVYDIEMQQVETDNIFKRMRYYQGKMDSDFLKEGVANKYDTLRKTYIIFICNFDLLGYGQCCYKIQNTCTLDDGRVISFDDDAHKIVLYTKGVGGSNNEIQAFLRYLVNSSVVEETQSSSLLVNAASKRVKEIRQSKEMEGIFMNLEEKIQAECEKERKKTLYENIQLMLKLNNSESEIIKKSEGRITSDDIEYVKSTQFKKQ